MAAQAFSSLADNALFIAAIALIQELHGPDWLAPMMKWTFALAYVVLAAFVGAFADSFPKGPGDVQHQCPERSPAVC